MEPIEILEKAKALIDHPTKWTIGSYARDGDDRPTMTDSKNSSKFDMVGAMFKAVGSTYGVHNHLKPNFKTAYEALQNGAGNRNLMRFNDALGREHSEIMGAFDRAIERLK